MATHSVADLDALPPRKCLRVESERLRKPLAEAERRDLGRAIDFALRYAGLEKKQVAAQLGKDPGQISRWISGTENVDLPALLSLGKHVRHGLVIALLEGHTDSDVNTEIVIRLQRKVG